MSAAAQAVTPLRRPPRLGAFHAFERSLYVYRRTWRGTVFISFLSPALYLAAMGLGIGGYVSASANAALPGGSYLAFLAPGLIAAQAMTVAAFECTYPVLGGILWNAQFLAMLSTPLRVRDIVAAHLCFLSFRVTLVTLAFLVIVVLFGAASSPWLVLSVAIAVLTGLAFGGPITAFAASQKTDSSFASLFRFGITPLFLFSGTFFPVEQLPAPLQPLAWLTPLFHGVALSRGLVLGSLDPFAGLLHLAVLAAYAVLGTIAAGLALRRRLIK
ncbi:MAG TPA: ABC transporter permease [Candidatus Limnocylindrales bacterium]|nr:ABC transporter permease [Candidatus Limnocylindrales bacterium]